MIAMALTRMIILIIAIQENIHSGGKAGQDCRKNPGGEKNQQKINLQGGL